MTLDSAGSGSYTVGMRKPASPETDRSEVAYGEWLAEEIQAGCAELEAGESVPAEKVWQELGLE